MTETIDIYCERTDADFWSEPANALTNLSFLAAAFAGFALARRIGTLTWDTAGLIALIGSIGIGSFLFHTLATRWAALADTLPILIFQIVFLTVYARRVAALAWPGVVFLIGLFFAAVFAAGRLPAEWLNGSLSYAPALIFVAGLGIFHRRAGKHEPHALLLAAAVFTVSLALRSIDMAVCDRFPLGTHLFWHLLNGLVLYLSVRAIIVNVKTAGTA